MIPLTLPSVLLMSVILFQGIPGSQAQVLSIDLTAGGVDMQLGVCTTGRGLGTALSNLNGVPIANLAGLLPAALIAICSDITVYVGCLETALPISTNTYDKLAWNTYKLKEDDIGSMTTLATQLCAVALDALDTRVSSLVTCFVNDALTPSPAIDVCVASLVSAAQSTSVITLCGATNAFITCAENVIKAQAVCAADTTVSDWVETSFTSALSSSCATTGSSATGLEAFSALVMCTGVLLGIFLHHQP